MKETTQSRSRRFLVGQRTQRVPCYETPKAKCETGKKKQQTVGRTNCNAFEMLEVPTMAATTCFFRNIVFSRTQPEEVSHPLAFFTFRIVPRVTVCTARLPHTF